jgi:hypothetical protein
METQPANRMSSNPIRLKPSSIAGFLGMVMFLLILASVGMKLAANLTGHTYIFGLVRLFDLDSEQNVPTFFATFLLLFADLLLWIITILKRNQRASHVLQWSLLSGGFFYMAADEASSIHELLNRPMYILLGNRNPGFLHFPWVVAAIPLVLVLALFFLKFLLRLPSRTRLFFTLAATAYIGGAVGVELIGGRIFDLYGPHMLYVLASTVEESLEMTGVIIFIWALLDYIVENYPEVRFWFDPVRKKVTPNAPEA